ncbi:DUF3558 domain-containing protein [Amycolatopsis sp. TNS106]|uniref:DUF3558 domain-containing protein n=1 Tax=Amycolatopsis sp. TNS106 TaxID=2861750 RepID=UPI001C584A66|nr:DUF3558 domain-containing protein [Amycolatopsis sp. TNS106]QXV60783.1 DUF3558 domain-containing protein [Amycolatopsis sp. TNS106]
MGSRSALLVLATAALLVSACSDSNNGNPTTPAPSSPAGQASSLPRAGAPNIDQPLDTAAAEADPCSVVKNDQVQAFGGGAVDRSRVEELSSGKVCTWVFANGLGTISAGMNTGERDGLSHLYALNAQGSGLTTFKPSEPIDGYPSVVFANGGERSYVCNLAVGVRNDLMYTIIATPGTSNPNRSDPCGMATKLGTYAIQHLKAAQ